MSVIHAATPDRGMAEMKIHERWGFLKFLFRTLEMKLNGFKILFNGRKRNKI